MKTDKVMEIVKAEVEKELQAYSEYLIGLLTNQLKTKAGELVVDMMTKVAVTVTQDRTDGFTISIRLKKE
jgi:hypothetical protein